MIALRVSSDLDRIAKGLEAQQGKITRAIAQGLNEGGDKVRTQVRRAMREQTGLIRLNSVTRREGNVRAFATGLAPKSGIGPSRGASLSYTIIYRGNPPTKPDEFRKSVTTGPGGGVTVWMWAVAHKFKRSFMQKFKGGLRMRLAGPRLPIRSFDGPNLAKEAVKGEVATTFLESAATLVPPIIEKRLARAL
jgi:hypothetical protein